MEEHLGSAPPVAALTRIEDYTYDLPPHLIAELPLPSRPASRLLTYERGVINDHLFEALPNLVPSQSLFVFNNSRVIEARLHFQKASGAAIEIFCLQPHLPAEMTASLSEEQSVQWSCLVGGASKWKDGVALDKRLIVRGQEIQLSATKVSRRSEHYIIQFQWTGGLPFAEVLAATGEIPLPPYIKRKRETWDAERYQTVFADKKGSVAAPTAALHFTPQVIDELGARGIQQGYLSLHVGAGTFKPVKAETIDGHDMHAETFSVDRHLLQSLIRSEKIIAVGTTSLRSLESLFWIGVKLGQEKGSLNLGQWEAYGLDAGGATYKEVLETILEYMEAQGLETLNCSTSLLILPGYRFRSAAALVTNFHQPRSTLLLLVAAFIGEDWKKVYDHALREGYRFLSYGDSSLLWRKD